MLDQPITKLKPAMAYFRRDGALVQASQRGAIDGFAVRAGFEIIAEFEDDIDSGPDGIYARPGFAKLLKQIELDGAHTIIVETASDFAPDPIGQQVGYTMLHERGIELIAADNPTSFGTQSPDAPIVQTVLDISMRLEQAISKALQRGTDKRRRTKNSDNWRRTYAEMAPDATLLAKRLSQSSRKNGRRISLREISAKLAEAGFVTRDSKPYHPQAISRMLQGAWPKTQSA